MDLTNEQWGIVKSLLPGPWHRPQGGGRPCHDARNVLNGILWILRKGASWSDMPERYPPWRICHRYLLQWARDETFMRVLQALADDLAQRGGVKISEAFMGRYYPRAKKGGATRARPYKAGAAGSWQSQTLMLLLSPSTLKALSHAAQRSKI